MRPIPCILAGAASALALIVALPTADAAWWNFGAAPRPAGASSDAPLILAQSEGGAERFNRIETQMRTLTGQVEELTFHLRQLQDQLKRMQEDNDFRLRELEGGGAGPARSVAPAGPPPADSAALPAPDVPTLPPPAGGQPDAIGAIAGEPPLQEPDFDAAGEPQLATPDFAGPGEPPRPLGSLSVDAPPGEFSEPPIDLTQPPPPPGSTEPTVAMIQPSGDARTDYERSYNSILNGDYITAEAGLRQFLATYPDDQLAPDAQYWLGESLFARAQFREAANEFLAGYKAYPQSGKAPDALLKLGLSLAGLGEREAACSTFSAVVKQYPDASNALKNRVKSEQASANC